MEILNASIGSNPSYAWRSIHKSIGLFSKEQDGEWEMGRQSIYGMIVVANTNNSKVISPRKDFADFPMVSALIDQDTRRWRKDVLDRIFLSFEVKNILSIPIRHYPQEDQLI